MPRGYRCVILAAFAGLILGAGPANEGPNAETQRTQREIADATKAIAASLNEANKPKRESTDCPKNAEDRKSDLCAQWKAADAAADSAYYAWQALVVGWTGAALGMITMAAAIAAAIFAKKAAEETKRGADAAESGVRSHIVLGEASIRFGGPDRGIRVKVVVKNDGGTPARKVKVSPRLQISPGTRYGPGKDDFTFGSGDARTSPWTPWHQLDMGYVIPANSSRTFEELVLNFHLSESEMAQDVFLRAGVQIKVTSIDVFKRKHTWIEYREVGDIRTINFNRDYPLTVDFGGGETEEWPCPMRPAYEALDREMNRKRARHLFWNRLLRRSQQS